MSTSENDEEAVRQAAVTLAAHLYEMSASKTTRMQQIEENIYEITVELIYKNDTNIET